MHGIERIDDWGITMVGNVQIPKEMGKSMWTYDKIISLLNA